MRNIGYSNNDTIDTLSSSDVRSGLSKLRGTNAGITAGSGA